MSESQISIKVVCPECGAGLALSRASLNMQSMKTALIQDMEKVVGDKVYYLQYFVCPDCGAWSFLQVDDDESKKVLARHVHAYMEIANGNKYRQTRSLYERTKSDLTIMRSKLEQELDGVTVHDPWGESMHPIRFIHL